MRVLFGQHKRCCCLPLFAFFPSLILLGLRVVTMEEVFWQASLVAGRSARDEASKLASDCFLQFQGHFIWALGGGSLFHLLAF